MESATTVAGVKSRPLPDSPKVELSGAVTLFAAPSVLGVFVPLGDLLNEQSWNRVAKSSWWARSASPIE